MSDDLISRKATIDAMEGVDWYHIDKDGQLVHGANSKEDEPLYKAKDVYVVLNKMPSAETHDKRTETHSCDLISRQAAQTELMMKCERYTLARESHGMGHVEWSDELIDLSDAIDAIRDLPPAQPEPIRINLNELIKVKLTDWGKEIYYHQYDRTNQIAGREICKPMFPREDENGYTEFQLWCFIELYGMHMGMTLPNVIEPLEIVYER